VDAHEIVAAVLVRDGRVLLCHRSPGREWFPNVWDLPGGHVEADELDWFTIQEIPDLALADPMYLDLIENVLARDERCGGRRRPET
jgi:hypothetical protein